MARPRASSAREVSVLEAAARRVVGRYTPGAKRKKMLCPPRHQSKKNHAVSEGIVAHKKLALGTKENPESDVTDHALRSSMSASVEKRAIAERAVAERAALPLVQAALARAAALQRAAEELLGPGPDLAEQGPLVARSVTPPSPPTSPSEMMERGDDTTTPLDLPSGVPQRRAPRSCTVFVMNPTHEHTSEGGGDDRGVPYQAESTLSTLKFKKKNEMGGTNLCVSGVFLGSWNHRWEPAGWLHLAAAGELPRKENFRWALLAAAAARGRTSTATSLSMLRRQAATWHCLIRWRPKNLPQSQLSLRPPCSRRASHA